MCRSFVTVSITERPPCRQFGVGTATAHTSLMAGARCSSYSRSIFCFWRQCRHGFTLRQGGLPPPQPEPCPNVFVTAAVGSTKTCKQLYRGRFWRVGAVQLVIRPVFWGRRLEKGRHYFALPQIFFSRTAPTAVQFINVLQECAVSWPALLSTKGTQRERERAAFSQELVRRLSLFMPDSIDKEGD